MQRAYLAEQDCLPPTYLILDKLISLNPSNSDIICGRAEYASHIHGLRQA